MRDAARRARLEASLERYLALLFVGRVLPVTQAIAVRWGRLDGMRQMAGRPLSAPDGMIAATALEHGESRKHPSLDAATGGYGHRARCIGDRPTGLWIENVSVAHPLAQQKAMRISARGKAAAAELQ